MIRLGLDVSRRKGEDNKLRINGWTARGRGYEETCLELSFAEFVKRLRKHPAVWASFRDFIISEHAKDTEATARKAAEVH